MLDGPVDRALAVTRHDFGKPSILTSQALLDLYLHFFRLLISTFLLFAQPSGVASASSALTWTAGISLIQGMSR